MLQSLGHNSPLAGKHRDTLNFMKVTVYTELRIGDIAVQCGFSDSNYFCKTFRAQTGISPRLYRLKNQLN